MNIKRWNGNVRPYLKGEVIAMENVLRMKGYSANEYNVNECEWDLIGNIFQKAIARKGLSKQEVNDISDRILDEVRREK